MMRIAIALLLAPASAAHADSQSRYTMAGFGGVIGNYDAGGTARIESRLTETNPDGFAVQGRWGFDAWWGAGNAWGFGFPIGMQVGGHAENARMMLGGGLGVPAFADDGTIGIAPYATSTIEYAAGPVMLSLDARVTRQVQLGIADFNQYSIVVMVGRATSR